MEAIGDEENDAIVERRLPSPNNNMRLEFRSEPGPAAPGPTAGGIRMPTTLYILKYNVTFVNS